jgi:RNA polymerase sigma factor (sigma-70 family)
MLRICLYYCSHLFFSPPPYPATHSGNSFDIQSPEADPGQRSGSIVATGLNNDLINALAQKYAETRNDDTFQELFEQLKPMVHNEAIKAERNNGIPRDTMISCYSEGIWQAARGEAVRNFDGSSQFTQRVHEFFKRRLADEIRHKSSGKRKGYSESLDKPVYPTMNDSITYGEIIPDGSCLEQDLTEVDSFRKALDCLSKDNENHSKVIEMLIHGNTNEEIAEAFGATAYNTRIRSLVKRARQSFRAYLREEKTLDYSG